MSFYKYNERKHQDQFEPVIDIDTGKTDHKELKGVDKNLANIYWQMIKWAIDNKRGGRPFPNLGKQFKAIKTLKEMFVPPKMVFDRWDELEENKFFQKMGIDFTTIVNSFEKRA